MSRELPLAILIAMRQDFHTLQIRRRHERIEAAMPVRWAGTAGVTRNVSADGIYFETGGVVEVGSEIRLDVLLDTPLGEMRLTGCGRVVRTERKDGRFGIAVRMTEERLERID